MAVAIAEMPLNREVAATLRGETTPLSGYLSLAVAYDQGEWDAVDALSARLGIPAEALPEAYHRTVSWIGRLAAA
jgi:c-di-GMP-related signal transduction protein